MPNAQVLAVAIDELVDAIVQESLKDEPGDLVVGSGGVHGGAAGGCHVDEKLDDGLGAGDHRVRPGQCGAAAFSARQPSRHDGPSMVDNPAEARTGLATGRLYSAFAVHSLKAQPAS